MFSSSVKVVLSRYGRYFLLTSKGVTDWTSCRLPNGARLPGLCHALLDCKLQHSPDEVILWARRAAVQVVPIQLARLVLELVKATLVFLLPVDHSQHDTLLQPFAHVALLLFLPLLNTKSLSTPALCTSSTNAVTFSLSTSLKAELIISPSESVLSPPVWSLPFITSLITF